MGHEQATSQIELTEEQQEKQYTEQITIRRNKLKELQDEGKDPYQINTWPQDTYAVDAKENYVDPAEGEEHVEGQAVVMAGRLMSKRVMGKASFANLVDTTDNIQIYVQRDTIGLDEYKDFKRLDIGDIIGVKGHLFRTKTGEISVKVTVIELLSKSLIPLPEKYHGLKDKELRYRQRYMDLIVNPEVKNTFKMRSKIISEMRRYFDDHGFMEVETPILQTHAGGAAARPFNTHHNSLDIEMHLRISLELYLKRLIVGGFDRVYEIGRNFRNEGMDKSHNPEFTMVELYQAYTDYEGMMDLVEDVIKTLAEKVLPEDQKVQFGEHLIDLGKPFERYTMLEIVKKYSGVDFNEVADTEAAKKLADEHHIEYEDRHKKGDILNFFYETYCEDKLIQPTFITGHPVEISPLAKKDPENPDYTLRFELFIAGHEYANAFSELNDPIDQRTRFEYQDFLKQQGDDEASGVDEDFLNALEYGMPPTGGIGIGIDRLVMLLTGETSIRDVLLFPTMKSLDK
jgi:lysyl-tRNA synthetase class 2